MKKSLTILAIFLLLINGIGALFGGWKLMTDPTGQSLHLSQAYLEHTFFQNYLIPGIILFAVNGLFSFVVIIWTLFKGKYFPALILVQGILLTGWIIVQMLLLQTVYFLHYVLGGMGIILILIGTWLSGYHTGKNQEKVFMPVDSHKSKGTTP